MKKSNASLGLELLARHLKPGQIPSHYLMAIWMNAAGERITRQRLQQIEQRCLRKLRAALYRDKELEQELKEYGKK